MPVEDTPCPTKQIIKKFVQGVPCPSGKPRKKQDVRCPSTQSRRTSKCSDDLALCNGGEPKKPKSGQGSVCSGNGNGKSARSMQKVSCTVKEKKFKGCPKCENNRIEKLECEVYQLRREIEGMKHERKATEKAVQRAILRGARALGGRFKPIVPETIEKLLDSCESNASSVSTSGSVTCCGRKSENRPCGSKLPKDSYVCEASCAD
ncbi:uncharacterized protein LOC117224799 [Megalopta genalis]|uniref:uncharacterized protein LOC117224799 n=1 Tax=Megalopta genalis TaxID=115081 RepID=UPI003FD445E7